MFKILTLFLIILLINGKHVDQDAFSSIKKQIKSHRLSIQQQIRNHRKFDLTFNPNKPRSFYNFLFWGMTIYCKIDTPDRQNLMTAFVKSGEAYINGKMIHRKVSMYVKNKSKFNLYAGAFTRVTLINYGKHDVNANCVL